MRFEDFLKLIVPKEYSLELNSAKKEYLNLI